MFFLTPVWGDAYVRLYLDVVIPAQLSPQNLPAVAGDPGTKYIIYTTAADMEAIRSAPIFELLNATVPVVFEPVDLTFKITHDRMSDCFRRGIAAANKADAAIVFLTPDIVFADGSFATLRRLAAQNYDTVFVPAIRTLKQGVSAALIDKFKAGRVIQIGPRDLMQTALDNLHPLADLSWWDEGETDLLPANLYWRVDAEGILARCFHLHPVYVRPQRKDAEFFGTVDDDFCSAACPDPSRDYVVCDSDEFLAIELSDPSRTFRTGLRKGSIRDAAAWAEQFANERHRALFDHTIRMHTGIRQPDLWLDAANKADRAAVAVKAHLAVSTWRLIMLSSASLLFRRFYRRAFDRQSRLANLPATAQTIGWRLLYSWQRWPIWLLGVYRAFVNTIRRPLIGPDAKPFLFTSNFLLQHLVRQDLIDLIGPIDEAVLITEALGTSPIGAVLETNDSSIPIAVLVRYGGKPRYVLRDASEVLAPESCDLILLELGDFQDIQKNLTAVLYTLRPKGRLLISTNHFLSSGPSTGRRTPDRKVMEKTLRPNFSVIDHKKQGGIGTAVKLELFNRIHFGMRRGPVPLRLLELIFLWLWVPLYVLLGGIFNALALILDLFDRKKLGAVSSLTLAEKITNADE